MRRLNDHARYAVPEVRTWAFTLAGFGCLTGAAFTISDTIGLVAAGASLLILERLSAKK